MKNNNYDSKIITYFSFPLAWDLRKKIVIFKDIFYLYARRKNILLLTCSNNYCLWEYFSVPLRHKKKSNNDTRWYYGFSPIDDNYLCNRFFFFFFWMQIINCETKKKLFFDLKFSIDHVYKCRKVSPMLPQFYCNVTPMLLKIHLNFIPDSL